MTRIPKETAKQGKRKREDSSSDDENEPATKKPRFALENREIVPANALHSNVAIATDDLLPASGYIEPHTDVLYAANLNGKAFQFSHDTIYYDDLLDEIIDAPVCPAELEYVQIHDGGSIDIGTSDSEEEDEEDDDAFIGATSSVPNDDDGDYIPRVDDDQDNDEDEYSTEDE